MKSIVCLVFVAMMIVSCSGSSKSDGKLGQEEEQVAAVQPKNDLVKIYNDYVADLDSNDVKSIASATNMYKQLFKNAREEQCDSAFLAFHHLYMGMTYILNEDVMNNVKLQETVWMAYDENEKKLPMPKAYINEEKKVKPYGYRLEFPEGMISIGYDRSYISKNFYSFVSPTMKSYLERLNKDNENTFGEDGAIIIDEKEFVDRLIWYENFEKKHPDFLLKNDVQATYRYLFTHFLIGANNTPVKNYGEDELSDYFKNAYALLEQKYRTSETWKRTKPYKQALIANDEAEQKKLLADYTKRGWTLDFK